MKRYYIEDEYSEREELSELDFNQSILYNASVAVEYGDYEDFEECMEYVNQELNCYGSVELNGFTYSVEEK